MLKDLKPYKHAKNFVNSFVYNILFPRVAFIPTPSKNLDLIMQLGEVKQGTNFFDLGSGDGRMVIKAAELGALATGVEINPFLIWYSQMTIKKKGLENNAKIIQKDFFKIDLSSADVVFTYLLPSLMKDFSQKFYDELKPGAKIISQGFSLPGWESHSVLLDDSNALQRKFRRIKKIYLYIR